MIRLPPGRGRLWSWTLDPSLFAILRKRKFALRSREGGHRSTWASSLERYRLLSAQADNNHDGLQPRMSKRALCRFRCGVPECVRSPNAKKRPVVSTGVQILVL